MHLYRSPDRLLAGPGLFEVVRCASCLLAYTSPRPSDLSEYYAATYPSFSVGRASRLQRLRMSLIMSRSYGPLLRRQPGRLLDVGCGTGELAAAFASRGWSVAGVEPSSHAAVIARRRAIDVHCGTLSDHPWPGACFDAVVFNHSLEHIDDPVADLVRAKRLLRRDGLVAISVPNFDSVERRVFRDRWFQLDLPRHCQHFTRSSLEHTLGRAGLDLVAAKTSTVAASLPGSLAYVGFGRLGGNGRGFRLLAYALLPVGAIPALFFGGNCLVAFAGAARSA